MFASKKEDPDYKAEWVDYLKEAREVLSAAGFPSPTAEQCIALVAVWMNSPTT